MDNITRENRYDGSHHSSPYIECKESPCSWHTTKMLQIQRSVKGYYVIQFVG